MHNIEDYGGEHIDCRVGIKVKFPTITQMNAWLKRMRSFYNTDQFSPFVNVEEKIVVY